VSDAPQVPPAAGFEGGDDPSIPLLTDRIFLPAVDLDTALPPSLVPAPAAEPLGAPEYGPSAPMLDEAAPAEAHVLEETQAAPDQGPLTLIEAEPAMEAAGAGGEGAVEAELDLDLVAASDADFDALLAAELQLATGDAPAEPAAVMPLEAAPAPPLGECGTIGTGHAAETASATVPTVDQATLVAQADALRADLLQQLSTRLPEQIDAVVRDLMQPAIDQAMRKLGEEAEVALRITLQELVDQVLREELQQRVDRSRS
jgi:hypothetical protein